MPIGFARSILASGAAEPTYLLTSNISSVNEGSSVVFTLTTTNVDQGTNVPYSVTGISSADLSSGSISGNFTVGVDGTATKSFTLSADATTEGNETFLMSVDSGNSTHSVTVIDSSKTATYSLSRSAASRNEGQSVTITLTTTNVLNGTNVSYTVGGISAGDLSSGSLSGNFTINNNSASTSFTLSNDLTTEGTETLTLSAGGQSINVTINDTSITPLTFSSNSWTQSTLTNPRTLGVDWTATGSTGKFFWTDGSTSVYNGQVVYDTKHYSHTNTSSFTLLNTYKYNQSAIATNGVHSLKSNNIMYGNGGWSAYWPRTLYWGKSLTAMYLAASSGWNARTIPTGFNGSPPSSGTELNGGVDMLSNGQIATHFVEYNGSSLTFQRFNIDTNTYTSFSHNYTSETGRTGWNQNAMSTTACYDYVSDQWFLSLAGYDSNFGYNIEIWDTNGYVGRFAAPYSPRWLLVSEEYLYMQGAFGTYLNWKQR